MLAATLLASAALAAGAVPGDVPGAAGLAARGDRERQGDDAVRRVARERVGLPRRRPHRAGRRARAGQTGRGAFGLKPFRASCTSPAARRASATSTTRAPATNRRSARLRRRCSSTTSTVTRSARRTSPTRYKPFLYVYPPRRAGARAVRAPDHRRPRLRAPGINANGIAATPHGKHADPRPEQHGQALHRGPADRRHDADRRPARPARRRHPAARQQLYVVQNRLNKVAVLRLDRDASSARARDAS